MDQPRALGFSWGRVTGLVVVTAAVVATHNLTLSRYDLDWAYVVGGIGLGLAILVGWIPAGRGRDALPWIVAAVIVGLVVWVVDPTDARLAGNSAGTVLGGLLVTLFGVAVLEEVLFRHWLLVGWSWIAPLPPGRPGPQAVGAGVSSLAFGLWHVAAELGRLGSDATPVELVPGILATTLAGLGLAWLRLRSRGVLAPILVHASFNTAVALAVWR